MNERNLIFIASQPRSGSTLLQKLLSNNPQTNTVSEPWIMLALAPLFKPSLVTGKYDHNRAMDALSDYESKFKELDVRESIRKLALQFYQPLFNGFDFVIDKTPRYWEIMDELLRLFPESKLIVVKRDPIAVANSMIRTFEVQSLKELNTYKRDLLIAPWQIHDFCERNHLNPNVYVLRYEDLVNDMETTMKKVHQWAGIEFRKNFLEAAKNTKYRGKYGDPFQNAVGSYEIEKNKSGRELAPVFKKFMKGYIQFLGKEFLKTYGNYLYEEEGMTVAFRYFEDLLFPNQKVSTRKIIVQQIRRRFV